MPTTTTWLVNPANPVHFAAWSGEESVVVYQSTSGDCHLISPMGAVVLELLQAAPCDEEAIFKDLFPDEEPVESAVATLRSNLLIQLEQLGLIEKSLS